MLLKNVLDFLITLGLVIACGNGRAELLEASVSRRFLISFKNTCDEFTATSRVLNSLISGETHRKRPALQKQEEGVVSASSVEDFPAYKRLTFSFKNLQVPESVNNPDPSAEDGEGAANLPQPGGVAGGEEIKPPAISRITRCSISQTSLKQVGVSVVSLETCLSVEAPALKAAFQGDPCVDFTEFDSIIELGSSDLETYDSEPPPDYWHELIDLKGARDLGACSKEIIIGVIDSGIACNHPNLQANLWVNKNEVAGNGIDDDGNGYIDDVNGFNFLNQNADLSDALGHGTHVAGIIGAIPSGLQLGGVCEHTSIAALRFIDDVGKGTTSTAIEALNYAVLMGFHLSCNSWGGPGYSRMLKRAITNAYRANHLFVTAAGNKAIPVDVLPEFPAALSLPNIITVAATDANDQLASFSNFGRRTVHLTAPGVNILSTYPPDTTARLSGTSMATPVVAAVAAMLLSVKYQPISKVRNAILASVDKSPHLWSRVKTGGRINALKAMKIYLEDDSDIPLEAFDFDDEENEFSVPVATIPAPSSSTTGTTTSELRDNSVFTNI